MMKKRRRRKKNEEMGILIFDFFAFEMIVGIQSRLLYGYIIKSRCIILL